MSTWLKLVNDLKQRPPENFLTETQRIAFEAICSMTRFPGWINLHGIYGTGKTYLSWALVRATGAVYVAGPVRLEIAADEQETFIVDNSPYREDDARRVLARCGLLGANTVVLVTRRPITMPMRRVELNLPSPDDLNTVIRSLGRMGYPCDQQLLPAKPTLWDVLQACI
ncbi:MAG: hypothetical protein HZC41_08550 [Chloroflexi bacterium]|nr:hypothetical protein [Chloroflexota bacterium]